MVAIVTGKRSRLGGWAGMVAIVTAAAPRAITGRSLSLHLAATDERVARPLGRRGCVAMNGGRYGQVMVSTAPATHGQQPQDSAGSPQAGAQS